MNTQLVKTSPVEASTVQCPAVRTTDLLSLLATAAEQVYVPPVAFWKNTLPAVVAIRPPPVQLVGEDAGVASPAAAGVPGAVTGGTVTSGPAVFGSAAEPVAPAAPVDAGRPVTSFAARRRSGVQNRSAAVCCAAEKDVLRTPAAGEGGVAWAAPAVHAVAASVRAPR